MTELLNLGLLSRLHCLHHGCASHSSGKSRDFHCNLCSFYIFL